MRILKKINKFLKNPYMMFSYLAKKRILNWMPDKLYIKVLFRGKTNLSLNINAPKSFNEKMQWLKLYDRAPSYVLMVDKYKVRDYIAKTIGEKYLIPLLGVYNKFDEINFDELPNKFVLKCTHDSGGLVICENKETFDVVKAKQKILNSFKRNYYYYFREWPYKNVKPRIICEEFMQDEANKELHDYKIYCFNGEPKYCQVIQDRSSETTIDFYDTNWNLMEFNGLQKLPNSKFKLKKPNKYNEMLDLAKTLSKNIPFVRVDFYIIKNHIYFGEITFFPRSGYGEFSPSKWNNILGDLIELPKLSSN